MSRFSVLALILTAVATAPAVAEEPSVAPATSQQLPLTGATELTRGQASGGTAVRHAPSRASAPQSQERFAVRPARLMPERRRQPGLVLPWRSHGRSVLALPLTDRWALGVGYDRVEGEDLWREFAELGRIDYDSHNVLLRAHWRF